MPLIRCLTAPFSLAGLILGLGFFCVSLTPSLLPRMFIMQGLLSGCVFAAGYGIGKSLIWLYDYMQLQALPEKITRYTGWAVICTLSITAVYTLSRMKVWQNSVRVLMEMPPIDRAYPVEVFLVSVVTALVLISFFRLLIYSGARAVAIVNRYMPRRISIVLGTILFALFLTSFVDKIILKAALDMMDRSFAATNMLLEEKYSPPKNGKSSGSRNSLIDWIDIGRNGKRFISDGPKRQEIETLTGRRSMEPIRVYAGFETGKTLKERARIALNELKRVKGFDRSVLIIATSTGTGWLDPSAVDTVEFIHAGDTAIVSLQYSYLPSWLTLMVEPELAQDAATALFKAVYGHWTSLPRDKRPKLYLFGLSLGALGSEFSADLITMIGDPVKGALWSGPPFLSATWKAMTADRNPDSLQWCPVYGDSRTVRFMTQDGFPKAAAGAGWGPLRIVYLQHASDPMTWFSPGLAFHCPAWLGRDRGRDVSSYFRWFPVVSFFQVAFDILASASVNIGYGHNFSPYNYIDAWLEITQPVNWRVEDTAKLKAYFADFNPKAL